jgi:hypothetical protein
MDGIPIDTNFLQTNLPLQIRNDLIKELKKSAKKQLEEQYLHES